MSFVKLVSEFVNGARRGVINDEGGASASVSNDEGGASASESSTQGGRASSGGSVCVQLRAKPKPIITRARRGTSSIHHPHQALKPKLLPNMTMANFMKMWGAIYERSHLVGWDKDHMGFTAAPSVCLENLESGTAGHLIPHGI